MKQADYIDSLDDAVIFSPSEISSSCSNSDAEEDFARLEATQSGITEWQPPWLKTGPIGFVLTGKPLFRPINRGLADRPRQPFVGVPDSSVSVSSSNNVQSKPRRSQRKLVKQKKRRRVVKTDSDLRDEILRKWAATIFAIGAKWMEDGPQFERQPKQTLELLFSNRATATLGKRGSDFGGLVQFTLASAKGWPPTVDSVFQWLTNNAGPGTRAQSVMQAVNFAIHVVGIHGLNQIADSRLLTGVVRKGIDTLGYRRQTPAFDLSDIQAIQLAMLDESFRRHSNEVVWYTLLFTLVCVALRARYSDLRSAKGFVLDKEQWIVPVDDLKTASVVDKRLRMHLVGVTRLMGPQDIIGEFDSLRLKLGMDGIVRTSLEDADASPIVWPLFPEIDGDIFRCQPASLSQVNAKIKQCMLLVGDQFAARRTVTSARAALVSAAWTLSSESKAKLLGHRLPSEPKSTMAYDRQRFYGPVRLLQKFLDAESAQRGEGLHMGGGRDLDESRQGEDDDLEVGDMLTRAAEDKENDPDVIGAGEATDSEIEEIASKLDSGEIRVPRGEFAETVKSWDISLMPRPGAGDSKWINTLTGWLHCDRLYDPELTMCGLSLGDGKYQMLPSGDSSDAYTLCGRCHVKTIACDDSRDSRI